MSLGKIHASKHLHLWTRTMDGAEFANALYENDVDGALAFLGVVKQVTKYSVANEDITIEQVMGSLDDGRGMYAGVPGLIVVLSRCDGGCKSPSWN